MPRKNINEHFMKERPEWTKRKHTLLDRYVTPAAMKMKQLGGAVALIDGYAGANAYGNETAGSTVIMVRAANMVRERGGKANVYACEPDPDRYEALCSNLATDIASGVLRPVNLCHDEALPYVFREVGITPAVVFLDPHTVTQMTLDNDILPWVERPNTDILGIFMSTQACRCCGQIVNGGASQRVAPEAYLGTGWRDGVTEQGAIKSFFDALGSGKQFKAIYKLRKREQAGNAYGIFGLSDHPDGFWLLSSAVAKDYHILEDFDHHKLQSNNLFADTDREDKQREAFETLVRIAAPYILKQPKLRGARLASYLFEQGVGIQELFGLYEERDFTSAAYHVLRLPDRRPHGKAERH